MFPSSTNRPCVALLTLPSFSHLGSFTPSRDIPTIYISLFVFLSAYQCVDSPPPTRQDHQPTGLAWPLNRYVGPRHSPFFVSDQNMHRCILCASPRTPKTHLPPRCRAGYLARCRSSRRPRCGETPPAGTSRPTAPPRYVVNMALHCLHLAHTWHRSQETPILHHSSHRRLSLCRPHDCFGRTATPKTSMDEEAPHLQTAAPRSSVSRELLESGTAIFWLLSRSRNMILLGFLRLKDPSLRSKGTLSDRLAHSELPQTNAHLSPTTEAKARRAFPP